MSETRTKEFYNGLFKSIQAIDDAVVPSARKRKAAAAAAGGNSSSAGASDTGASTPPSKVAPAPLFGGKIFARYNCRAKEYSIFGF